MIVVNLQDDIPIKIGSYCHHDNQKVNFVNLTQSSDIMSNCLTLATGMWTGLCDLDVHWI